MTNQSKGGEDEAGKYFGKILIPKECLEMDQMVGEGDGGMRKRKVEEVGATEDVREPPRTKSKLTTKYGAGNPEELTSSEGTFSKLGAKSISGRVPTDGLGIGAKECGLIGWENLKNESKTPGGIGPLDKGNT